jgi:GT2 family glycosyltransferase
MPATASQSVARSEPTVTVVIVPRERFGHALRSLASVLATVDPTVDVVYVDGNSPPAIAAELETVARTRGMRLMRHDRFLSPNEARNLGLAEVRTRYAVCIDNDGEFEPGWLDLLVRCAEETGAWAVAPLYFEGSPGKGIVHMACGTARISEEDGRRTFRSEHTHAHRHVSELEPELRRCETELFEFHCVLLRMEPLRSLLPLDEALLSNHEHEDLALAIREAGGTIWMEPASRMTYVFGALDAYDAQYASLRWSDDWNRRSAERFRVRWRLHPGWGESSVDWCNGHREMLLRTARPRPVARPSWIGRGARAMLGARLYEKLRRSV